MPHPHALAAQPLSLVWILYPPLSKGNVVEKEWGSDVERPLSDISFTIDPLRFSRRTAVALAGKSPVTDVVWTFMVTIVALSVVAGKETTKVPSTAHSCCSWFAADITTSYSVVTPVDAAMVDYAVCQRILAWVRLGQSIHNSAFHAMRGLYFQSFFRPPSSVDLCIVAR